MCYNVFSRRIVPHYANGTFVFCTYVITTVADGAMITTIMIVMRYSRRASVYMACPVWRGCRRSPWPDHSNVLHFIRFCQTNKNNYYYYHHISPLTYIHHTVPVQTCTWYGWQMCGIFRIKRTFCKHTHTHIGMYIGIVTVWITDANRSWDKLYPERIRVNITRMFVFYRVRLLFRYNR